MKMTGDWEIVYYTVTIEYKDGTIKTKMVHTEESAAKIVENLVDTDVYSVRVSKLLDAVII